MKIKKTIVVILIINIFSLFIIGAAIEPTERFYINDFSDVLSDEVEDYIYENSKSLYDESGAQLVVTTIKSLDGEDIKEYSLNLARQWGIGTKGDNNGVLILLVTEDRKVRVEVGYGLEGALTDSKVGAAISDYALPYYKENDFESGTKNLYSELLREVRKEYNLEIPDNLNAVEDEEMDNVDFACILIIFIVFLAILFYIVYYVVYFFLCIIDLIFKTTFSDKLESLFSRRHKNKGKNKGKSYSSYSDSYDSYDSSDSSDSGGGGDFGGGGSDDSF